MVFPSAFNSRKCLKHDNSRITREQAEMERFGTGAYVAMNLFGYC